MRRKGWFVFSALMLLSLMACGDGEADNGPEETPMKAKRVPARGARYYHSDENAEHLLEEPAALPRSYGPQNVINLLMENGVLPEGVVVNRWEVDENDVMYLDLNAVFLDELQRMGTTGEYLLMGSIANSLVTNFDLTGVFVTAEGEILKTGHRIYDDMLTFFDE